MESMTQRLAGRLQEITKGYADLLPALDDEVDALSDTISKHLKTIGVV